MKLLRTDRCASWITDFYEGRVSHTIYIHNRRECWYKDGNYHKIGGPAVIENTGDKIWFQDGMKHREDGPAMIFSDGHFTWWWKGEFLTAVQWATVAIAAQHRVASREAVKEFLQTILAKLVQETLI